MSGSGELSDRSLLLQRTQHVLKVLVEADFYGPHLPSVSNLVQMMRLPKHFIQGSLTELERQGVLYYQSESYNRVRPKKATKKEMIGVITHADLFHPSVGVYQDFLIGAAEILHNDRYDISFMHELNTVEAKLTSISEMEQRGYKAIMILGVAEAELRKQMVERRIPTVICGNRAIDQTDLGCVCTDNQAGMRRLVKQVVEAGHVEIAYYTTDVPHHDGFYGRLLGYREGMNRSELPLREELVSHKEHNLKSACWAAEVYASLSRKPTAIVCGSDRHAYELIAELKRSGIRVPTDVNVVGFDNCLYDFISEVGLTTMDVHGRDMGRIAGNFLLNEIQSPQLPVHIVVPCSLVARDSLQDFETYSAGLSA